MTALVILPGLDGTATLHTEFIASVGSIYNAVIIVPYPLNEDLGYVAPRGIVTECVSESKPEHAQSPRVIGDAC